jgi:hypothetical protein
MMQCRRIDQATKLAFGPLMLVMKWWRGVPNGGA